MTTFAPIKDMSKRPVFTTNKQKKLNFDSDQDEEYILTEDEDIYFSEEDDYDESWDYYKRLWGNLSGPPKIRMLDYALNIVGYRIIKQNYKNNDWNDYNTLYEYGNCPNLTELGKSLNKAGFIIIELD